MKDRNDYLYWVISEAYKRDDSAMCFVDWIAAALLAVVILLVTS